MVNCAVASPDVPTEIVDVDVSAHIDSAAIKKKDNIIVKFVKQLLMGNKDRTFEKAIDLSFAVYPSYSNESSFGLGGMVSGLYRIDKSDSLLHPSDVKLLAEYLLQVNITYRLRVITSLTDISD